VTGRGRPAVPGAGPGRPAVQSKIKAGETPGNSRSRPNRATGDFPILIPGQMPNARFSGEKNGPGKTGDFPISRFPDSPIPDWRLAGSINCSGLGVYSAASIMPLSAVTGSMRPAGAYWRDSDCAK
jgi:hypothetical protein